MGINVPKDFPCQISHCWVILQLPFLEMAKTWPFYGQNMVLTWPYNLVLPESLALCPGMFHAKFYIAGCILYPTFLEMANTWPFYGQNMVLPWSFKLFLS